VKPYYVYILLCHSSKGYSLYTGIALDVLKRVDAHASGKGAKYTKANLPVKILYVEKCESKSAALKREATIKKLSRNKKTELINSNFLPEEYKTDIIYDTVNDCQRMFCPYCFNKLKMCEYSPILSFQYECKYCVLSEFESKYMIEIDSTTMLTNSENFSFKDYYLSFNEDYNYVAMIINCVHHPIEVSFKSKPYVYDVNNIIKILNF
jgi:putative endonuclease